MQEVDDKDDDWRMPSADYPYSKTLELTDGEIFECRGWKQRVSGRTCLIPSGANQ